jgi:lantibiotic modifying enzyme
MRETSFLEVADSIGSRLCRDAIWFSDRCNWLGWSLDAVNNSWTLVYRAQNTNLYDGTAGIALFLARLFVFTQDRLQKMTAMAALNQALAGVADIPSGIRPSVYSGAAGIGFAAIELGMILEDDRMIAHGLKILREAAEISPDHVWLDVLGGSAGVVQALLNVASRLDLPDLVELAAVHGRRLLRAPVKSERGWSWNTLPGQTEQHLTGYGHGCRICF